ncbi:hypothetical protein [Cellulomonas sp. PSBB021]|uniref:hypothetical protein n=1 Tax=Cellulomonas sp. PSBB021 TaxID=2003551 RepID=UPI000B8D8651|nr:hypothetical protein [Cellulomonas sp. PSBB021]ASR55717.1 hypothetical protein CBP52_12140 [Cellulomonas sp. PSBB021]
MKEARAIGWRPGPGLPSSSVDAVGDSAEAGRNSHFGHRSSRWRSTPGVLRGRALDDLFDEIRQFSLQHHVDGLRAAIARLSELACKVMHNATGGTPQFDDDSGISLVEATATLARLVPDPELALGTAAGSIDTG